MNNFVGICVLFAFGCITSVAVKIDVAKVLTKVDSTSTAAVEQQNVPLESTTPTTPIVVLVSNSDMSTTGVVNATVSVAVTTTPNEKSSNTTIMPTVDNGGKPIENQTVSSNGTRGIEIAGTGYRSNKRRLNVTGSHYYCACDLMVSIRDYITYV